MRHPVCYSHSKNVPTQLGSTLTLLHSREGGEWKVLHFTVHGLFIATSRRSRSASLVRNGIHSSRKSEVINGTGPRRPFFLPVIGDQKQTNQVNKHVTVILPRRHSIKENLGCGNEAVSFIRKVIKTTKPAALQSCIIRLGNRCVCGG